MAPVNRHDRRRQKKTGHGAPSRSGSGRASAPIVAARAAAKLGRQSDSASLIVAPGALKTRVPGVIWPVIQIGDMANRLAIMFQLQQTEWWSPERLREHQFAQLALLLRHAGQNVPYYRDLFARLGFDPRAPLSEESWTRLPLLTRRDIQDQSAALQTSDYPASHGRIGLAGTSGSTAMPIKVAKTQLQQLLWECGNLRDHLWHRRDLSLSTAKIGAAHPPGCAPYPDGKHHANWGNAVAPFQSGPAYFLDILTTIDLQLEWILRIKPAYLNLFPSSLEALAYHCRDTGTELPFLKGLRTNSELLRDQTRVLCREVFGLEIADMYTSAEAGNMALQSPDADEYLVQAETVFLEVLDDHGQACKPGEVGRVVTTPLHAFAMPLIRYANGDLAEVGARAACGRGLPVLKRMLGRERQMMRLPSGQRFLPGDLTAVVTPCPAIRQFQFVRAEESLMEVRLVTTSRLTADDEAGLRQRIRDKFRHPFEIRLIYMEEIPREPSGKFFDFKTLVG